MWHAAFGLGQHAGRQARFSLFWTSQQHPGDAADTVLHPNLSHQTRPPCAPAPMVGCFTCGKVGGKATGLGAPPGARVFRECNSLCRVVDVSAAAATLSHCPCSPQQLCPVLAGRTALVGAFANAWQAPLPWCKTGSRLSFHNFAHAPPHVWHAPLQQRAWGSDWQGGEGEITREPACASGAASTLLPYCLCRRARHAAFVGM